MRLDDPTNIRTWKYVCVDSLGKRSQPHQINQYLTGAVLGNQLPARISFRCALWIVHGWNQLGIFKYRLVIPNPQK